MKHLFHIQQKQAAKERERQQRIAEAEVENMNSDRNLEIQKFQQMLNQHKLTLFEVFIPVILYYITSVIKVKINCY